MNLFNKTVKDEYARVIKWEPPWSTGASYPHVFADGQNIYLIYLINEPHPNFDGTNPREIDNTSDVEYPLALITFDGNTFKFGIANDEVYGGLPLWGKGLEFYSAHIVENSKWIKEIDDINKVHLRYNPDRNPESKHYMFLFHDELFEVITRDFKVETFRTTFKELAKKVIERMYKK